MDIVADTLLGDRDFLYTVEGGTGLEHWDTEAFEKRMSTLDAAEVRNLTRDHFSIETAQWVVGAGLQVEFLRAWKSCMERKIAIVRTRSCVKALLMVVTVDKYLDAPDDAEDTYVRREDKLLYLGNCTICMRVGPVGFNCPNQQCKPHVFVPLRFDADSEFAVDEDRECNKPMGDPVHLATLFGHSVCDVVRNGNMYDKYGSNSSPMRANARLLCHRLKCRPGSRTPAPVLYKDRQVALYGLARAIGAESAEVVEPLFAANVGTSSEDVKKNLEAAMEQAKGAEWKCNEWRMSVSPGDEVVYLGYRPNWTVTPELIEALFGADEGTSSGDEKKKRKI